tara:strand:+ start:599 stop:934 length:336 start_codon:yes stop_codon:yes gene_type:complete
MPYTEINDYNMSEGIVSIFKYSVDTVPVFMDLTLIAIFLIAFLGTFFAQKRLGGRGDFVGSFAVASWLLAIIAIVFSLASDLISLSRVVISITLAVVALAILYFNRMDQGL